MATQALSGSIECAGFRLEWTQFFPAGASRGIHQARVVMLHEGLGSIAQWRDFPQQLAHSIGEPVVAYSRRGYGRSSPHPGPWTSRFMHDEALQQLPLVLDALGISNPILLGHSDGGSIALIHAAHNPKVRAVAVMAPHLFVEPLSLASIAQAREAFEQGKLAAGLAKFHDRPTQVFEAWCAIWLSSEFASWNIEHEVAAIQCPILAIQGVQDQYGSARQVQSIGELRPASQSTIRLIDQCRHSPHLDQPDETLRLISTFIHELR